MTPLILREGDPARAVDLSGAAAEALGAGGVLDVWRTERPERWLVTPRTSVGVVSVSGQQIVIQPKIGIDRLIFLASYARHPSFWRDESVELEADSDLPEALAHAFIHSASRALDQGLLKGYHAVEESLPVVRGRIREADQIRHRFGRSMPLEVRYDDFTVDIAENQLLLAASQRLLRAPGVARRYRPGLQRLRQQLADVSVPPVGVQPSWTRSRLNARYVPALELAELILAGHSFEQRVGTVLVSGYLFNMATVFEDFVGVALREAMRPRGGRVHLQFRTHLDGADTVPVRPDIVWTNDGVPSFVADAKYKAEKPSGFPQADLYQMLAYCTVLGLPRGHLIYAAGNEQARSYAIRGSHVHVVAHTLDLGLKPPNLLAQVRQLAGILASVPAAAAV